MRDVPKYSQDMKVTASLQLSEDLLAAVDERARRQNGDRSSVIEAAVRAFIVTPDRGAGSADLEILNRQAEPLNREAEDVLAYQILQ
jgi:predicted transcriptional regulator